MTSEVNLDLPTALLLTLGEALMANDIKVKIGDKSASVPCNKLRKR